MAVCSDEVSSVIRGNNSNDSFVVVKAGTEAYVLITDLPGEQRDDSGTKNLPKREIQFRG